MSKRKMYSCCGLIYPITAEKCVECGERLTEISIWECNWENAKKLNGD